MSAGAAHAHHGWSSYDAAKLLKITAQISTVSYENPHGMLSLVHDGKPVSVYLAPPARMMARGLASDALTVGKEVTIVAYPNTTNAAELRAERITVDGKTVELR